MNKSIDNSFYKSDIGAQSAWKGFWSQTLYIAERIVNDPNNYTFYPEDNEDLIIKKEEDIIEAVQIKNISSDLTLSSLASTKSSNSGEGFFNRVCSLHTKHPKFEKVRVVYFNTLGYEMKELVQGNKDVIEMLLKKLTQDHGLTHENATWLLSSITFEKVDIEQLQNKITKQISDYVESMAAPDIAQALLIQYVLELSKSKGHTSLKDWQMQMHKIGVNIAAIDGYYKEYQKSLVRMDTLILQKDIVQIRKEFEEGVSTQPSHVRNSLDLPRDRWLKKTSEAFEKTNTVIIKGVSGQGKTTLCYRYLLDNYPEQLVFCVRSIVSVGQAENLAVALSGILKHTDNLIVYIDVNPGELKWVYLIQELQARGISLPVLVSIRDEDYNMTQINGSAIDFELIELKLSQDEARSIYDRFTEKSPHPQLRSFEEAWGKFGENGPMIEFMYLLTNNQPLRQRLQAQINNLLLEKVPDSWLTLLQLVCFAGRIGCPLKIKKVKQEVCCDNIYAALKRFGDEYLIKTSEDGQYIEALHSQRAQIICDILKEHINEDANNLLLTSLKCIKSRYTQLILMDFFSEHPYSIDFVHDISTVHFNNWIAFAGVIRTMLWLDVKRYIEQNCETINTLVTKRGSGWLTFMPLDISGMIRPNETILDSLAPSLTNINKDEMLKAVQEVKDSLTSMQIDYEATNCFINQSEVPSGVPVSDNEWSSFGYSLFWSSKCGEKVEVILSTNELTEKMISGDIQSKADAIRGLYEQYGANMCYSAAVNSLIKRISKEYCLVTFSDSNEEIRCKFVPPMFEDKEDTFPTNNFNHYWKIKLLNILQQMYPHKEYIEIELAGVDLLQDLGINAIDHKVRIHKSNRHASWITEINGWKNSRIDYFYRPNTWGEYVSRVDEIRKLANKLIVETKACIDNLYSKQRLNKKRWDKVINNLAAFKNNLFMDMLLPKSVVDPYCLYREGMQITDLQEKEQAQLVAIVQFLSYSKYIPFRKSFSETYSQLEVFFNQFSEVLLARIEKKNLDSINNPKLPLFNLFNSAKALLSLQNEYNKLFLNYSTLDEEFNKQELESIMTLVNIWGYVSENPTKGYPIAYNAKQRYRKSESVVTYALNEALDRIEGEHIITDESIYLMVEFDPFSDSTIENEYTKAILQLRESYKSAVSFGSERWYLEADNPRLIYVPVYKGISFLTGFEIPIYKILDANKEMITSSMFPAELPSDIELNSQSNDLKTWKRAITSLGTARLLIKQYNDILAVWDEESCCDAGAIEYIGIFSIQFSKVIDSFSDNIAIVLPVLEKTTDNLALGLVDKLKRFLNDIQGVYERIEKVENISDDIEEMANIIVSAMILLQSEIIECSNLNV